MGALGAVMGYVGGAFKSGMRLFRVAKTAARNGINASRIINNPRLVYELFKQKLIGMAMGMLYGAIAQIVLVLLVILVIIASVATMASAIIGTGDAAGNFRNASKSWVETLDPELLKEMQRKGMVLHPTKLKAAIATEESISPKNSIATRNTFYKRFPKEREEYLNENNIETGTTETQNTHPFEVGDNARPYRLYYEALIGLEILKQTGRIPENTDIMGRAKEALAPVFEWSFDHNADFSQITNNKYEKTIYTSTYVKKLVWCDGSLVEQEEYQDDYKHSYPLPFLDAVSTMFKDYTFTYVKEIVEDTGWVLTQPYPQTRSWITIETVTEKNADGTTSTTTITHHWSSSTWHKTKKRVKEDVLQWIEEKPNTRFFEFLKTNKINTNSDPLIILEIAKGLPDNEDFVNEYSEVLGSKAAGMLGMGDNGEYYETVPIAGNMPMIKGAWSRADMMHVAESLLTLYGPNKPIHYFWGGKYFGKGYNSSWGTPKMVSAAGSWSTNRYIPNGMDCSGFVTWVYNQMLLTQGHKGIPTGSVTQVHLSSPIKESELRPGDLGFYPPTKKSVSGGHVGLYLGQYNGRNVFIHLAGRTWKADGYPAGRLVITYNSPGQYLNGSPASRFTQFRRLNVKFAGE